MYLFTHSPAGWHFAGLPVTELGIAIAGGMAAYALMLLGLRLAGGRLRRMASRTSNSMDDVLVETLASTNRWLLLAVGFLVGLGLLDLGPAWSGRLTQAWFVALALQAALWGSRAIGVAVRRYEIREGRDGVRPSASGTLLSWFLRTVLWAVLVLAILSNVGVDITALVASLGVGGIAIALAVQNILGDLFASLSIAVDKPFEVGDFIVSDAGTGTVEYVGLKTTRIRALGGEQIVVGNTELLKQPVKNFRRMRERRIAFRFGVTYDTPALWVERIPSLVRELVDADALLRFDRAHFHTFGESALEYEVVYHVLDPDYNAYMDAQQRLNLGLLRALQRHGIEFAFPSRTLYLAGAPKAAAALLHHVGSGQPEPSLT